MIEQLLEKCASQPNRNVQVEAIIHPDLDHTVLLNSTLGRELWFCVHHAGELNRESFVHFKLTRHLVHHHALIKAIAIENNIELPKDFGMAPSTQVIRREKQPASSHTSQS
jgi:hypothetical protein